MRGFGLGGAIKAISYDVLLHEGVDWTTYGMNVRGHNFITATLPPPPIVVLIETLDIQLNWNQPQWRHTVTAHWILHGECGVIHEAVRAVQIVKSL
jgi:hypothetical protein